MSISALQAQIAKLEALIAEAEVEIKVCEDARTETESIVEDTINCVGALECVEKNLAHGLVVDGESQEKKFTTMRENLVGFNKNMEANIQALTERISLLTSNIASWSAEIASLQAEIQRLIEEAERKAALEAAAAAAKKRVSSYQSGGF